MNTTRTIDQALVARLARGDEQALAGLYDRHGRTAYALALRILRDPRLAEDAVQEAFLALWRAGGSFDPARGTVGSWIHVLVHRRAVDLVRREERQRAAGLVAPAEVVAEDGPDELVLQRETRDEVASALERLAPGQREVVELAFYGGLSQSEIADRLDLPLGTVKSRTFAALARLRELLAERSERAARRPEAVERRPLVLAA